MEEKEYWFETIKMENPVKYPAKELKSTDMTLDMVERVQKTYRGVKVIDEIRICFNDVSRWCLVVGPNSYYGRGWVNVWTMAVCSGLAPWRINFSELNINDKRSIKTRIEQRTLYAHLVRKDTQKYGAFIRVDENPEYDGKKGRPLKR